jgi:hypothetical protein
MHSQLAKCGTKHSFNWSSVSCDELCILESILAQVETVAAFCFLEKFHLEITDRDLTTRR